MMKLSFSSLGCPGWSYEQLLDEAARDGYAGLEIRGVGGEMRADKIDCFAIGRQQDARRAAQARGVKLIVRVVSRSGQSGKRAGRRVCGG